MKLLVASVGAPTSFTTWSGTPAHIIAALTKRGHEIVSTELTTPVEPWYFDWLRRLYFRLQRRWFLSAVEPSNLRQLGSELDIAVKQSQPDVVLAIHGDILAYTTFQHPACIIHDTTFNSLVDYYPAFTRLSKRSIKAGNAMYQRALSRADAAVFSSKWASDSALNYYGTEARKINTIPFGANILVYPSAAEVDEQVKLRSNSACCKLLFIGIDWERKGGPDAVKIVNALNQKGVSARLIVVGCRPIIEPNLTRFVDIVGFISKASPAGIDRLSDLLHSCSALLVPSLSECYGCVYCEANAFGLPALGRDTGGIPEIIHDGENGLLLREAESCESFADRWSEVWINKGKYAAMSRRGHREFISRLNYDVFARKLEIILKSISGGQEMESREN